MEPKRVLLIEPGYPNKYPPLGLMKLAAYHGPNGRGDHVRFIKGDNHEAIVEHWDRIYVTTLFSFEWKRTAETINLAIRAAHGRTDHVFVGGIAASLMHDQFTNEPAWRGVRFIPGVLEKPPSQSLMLSPEQFGHEDTTGPPIEDLIPDYSILEQIQYQYPVRDAYFGYTTRGCVRKCSFCGVPQLEGAQRDKPPIENLVNGVSKRHGERKDLILMDNNVVASPRFPDIIDEIVDLGFTPSATLQRPGHRPVRRRVDFNQGVDARILSKSPMYLRQMSRICVNPLRIAFDHIGLRNQYETSVHMAADSGLSSISNYMLYNFMDSPDDLYQRMQLNLTLNETLGVNIWSFPMRYQPVDLKDRSHVGPKWNRHRLRSFQIMLQATHGVVSAKPEYFTFVHGPDLHAFRRLLDLPHTFLFNRQHYHHGPGQPIRLEYERLLDRMSAGQQREMSAILSGPQQGRRPNERTLTRIADDASTDPLIARTLRFHAIDHRADPMLASDAPPMDPISRQMTLPEDQAVEDAGLYDPDDTA